MILPAISERAADAIYWSGNGMVLIGAVAGVLGAFGVLWGDRVRDYFSEQRISNNELKTATAYQQAAIANQRAEDARLETAELQKQTSDERTMREALAAQTAPRILSNDQASAITEKMRPYEGQAIDIISFGSGAEGDHFAVQLADCLLKANWRAIPWTVGNNGMMAPAGITIFGATPSQLSSLEKSQKLVETAKSLADAINSQGISVYASWLRLPDISPNMPDDAIMIGGGALFWPVRLSKFEVPTSSWTQRGAAPLRLFVGPRN